MEYTLTSLYYLLGYLVWRINVCYWREKFGDFDKMPCVIDDSTGEKHVYLLPMHEYPGLVKIAYHSGIDCDPDRRDEHAPTDDREVKIIQRFINNYLPGIDGNKPVITESCMYTVTPDWELVLDHHPSHPNIVIGCGFSGHGFKLAPVVGKILSELATGQEPSYDISALRISRFGKSVVSKASL
ncbi:putative peroxisomal sarcosine oxidase [Apostichopus japonicus]|uniref:Putative peroxisomal sarcosine oxidase n=1 Tax=Stichopus japonicus TaxID=307972 RepID=A0A2G8JXQ7_STIJA|nr:putative peroxisomal sarcosine oxidase [Apostichopus japonicus]